LAGGLNANAGNGLPFGAVVVSVVSAVAFQFAIVNWQFAITRGAWR